MARRMVMRFGMSDVIGLMAVGDADHEVFLGRELVQRRDVSEHTAQQVDQEVKRLLDEAHGRARSLVEANRDLLEAIAEALLERETLGRGEIESLARGEPLPPLEGVPERAAVEGGGPAKRLGGDAGRGGSSGEPPSGGPADEGGEAGYPERAPFGGSGDAGVDEAEEGTPSGVSRFRAAGPPPPEGDVSP
jgi:cell division protease FtsH